MSELRWWSVASRKPERLVLKIDGFITSGGLQGLDELIALAKEPEILLRVDCPGGSLEAARAVQRALALQAANVIVRIEGAAASASGLITCAGRTVQAMPEATMMIHAPYIERGGNARVLRHWADTLDLWARDMAHAMALKSGRNADTFLAMLADGEDHTLTAIEARELGLVDVILSGAQP
jgi:ATP-dependent Clp protease, protease subunit